MNFEDRRPGPGGLRDLVALRKISLRRDREGKKKNPLPHATRPRGRGRRVHRTYECTVCGNLLTGSYYFTLVGESLEGEADF